MFEWRELAHAFQVVAENERGGPRRPAVQRHEGFEILAEMFEAGCAMHGDDAAGSYSG